MIASFSDRYVVSSIGWVDKGSLWILDTENENIELVEISEADYVSIHAGKKDYFVAVHHFIKTPPKLTVHRMSDPGEIIGSISIAKSGIIFDGETDVWKFLPKAYIDYFPYNGQSEFWLCLIEAENKKVDFQSFEWYDDSYDKGYQGIVSVSEIPDSPYLLVSVQRSSELIMYDPKTQKRVGKVSLAGHLGNPEMFFRAKARELWVNDYDVLLKLDISSWRVTEANMLQYPDDKNMNLCIGGFAFDHDEKFCVVARPFCGDVVSVNLKSLTVENKCDTGNKPLYVSVLRDGRFFARNWEDGALLKGKIKHKSWFGWL